MNLGKRPYTIFPDDRVCQLIVLPYAKVDFVEVDELEDSDRGSDGYGSTADEVVMANSAYDRAIDMSVSWTRWTARRRCARRS